ncbi:MAG: DUF3179 domain-containing protein [Candidatus Rokubacteria bacterium]|nr:DUF3179 domain-containing protein [Candidatus Rokubacteria bacterium]
MQRFLSPFRRQHRPGRTAKDGIPSIDRPRFVTAAEADGFLLPTDVVFGVDYRGVVRAYPQRILVWHEIVNDVFDGQHVAITYCPLTGSPVGFLPPRNNPAETFGTSGNLVNSNLLMYDRVTDSQWPQILGTAINGERCAAVLPEIPVVWTPWDRWRQRHPDTEVLSADTGYLRNYGQDPYGLYTPDPAGYYASDGLAFPVMRTSDRFHPKKVFYGLKVGDARMAIPHEEFRAIGVRNFSLAGAPLAALYDPVLDIARVFRREVEGQVLTFALEGGTIRDADTGSSWSPEGQGLDGPLQGVRLEQVNAFNVMWFAWYAFYPETQVLDG